MGELPLQDRQSVKQTKIIPTMCYEPAVSWLLKWLLQRQGPSLHLPAVSCHVQNNLVCQKHDKKIRISLLPLATRMQPVANQLRQVPYCNDAHCRRVALIRADRLLIESVCSLPNVLECVCVVFFSIVSGDDICLCDLSVVI